MNRVWLRRVLALWAVILGFAPGCFETLELDPAYCPDPRLPGDGKSGLQCWDPPENYCKEDCNYHDAWFCLPDGTKCCFSTCFNCFHCGWVNMDECRLNDAPEGALPPNCDELLKVLPSPYGLCIENPSGPACQPILDDPECDIDLDSPVCH